MTTGPHVAIIGGGSIGVALSVVFARAGIPVRVVDADAAVRAAVPGHVAERLALITHEQNGQDPNDIVALVTVTADLEHAVQSARMVFECVTERLEVKREIFARILQASAPDAPIASTSSAFTPSEIAGELPSGRERCLVMHPINPPYLIPVIEVVPAPFTAVRIVDAATAMVSEVGLEPVRLAREVTGFVFNRLQGAVLREAYCLVRDGVIDVEGLDAVVRDALAPRWSIVGPFETVDLNTRGGIAAHAERMGPAYERMGAERGQHDPWTPDLVAEVTRQRRALLPLAQWDERVMWRDRELAARARPLRITSAHPREGATDES